MEYILFKTRTKKVIHFYNLSIERMVGLILIVYKFSIDSNGDKIKVDRKNHTQIKKNDYKIIF